MTTQSLCTVLQRGGQTLRRFARERDGAAVVEFAIVVMLLLVVVMGSLDWSRYFMVRTSVTNAVRDGARYGATLGTLSADVDSIRAHTRRRITDTVVRNLTTVTVSFPVQSGVPLVQVKAVSGPYNPFSLLVIKSAKTITDSAAFRREQP